MRQPRVRKALPVGGKRQYAARLGCQESSADEEAHETRPARLEPKHDHVTCSAGPPGSRRRRTPEVPPPLLVLCCLLLAAPLAVAAAAAASRSESAPLTLLARELVALEPDEWPLVPAPHGPHTLTCVCASRHLPRPDTPGLLAKVSKQMQIQHTHTHTLDQTLPVSAHSTLRQLCFTVRCVQDSSTR